MQTTMILWGLVLGTPLAAFGAVCAAAPERARRFAQWFEGSRAVAVALALVAWLWTARELDTIGIDVFDMVLKRFTGEVWYLALALAYLTIIWMPKNLPVRALAALMMLFPASLFRTTRLLVPDGGFALVHVFVAFAYAAAIVGMYGMFYPWRLEKGLGLAMRTGPGCRAFGAGLAALGVLLVAAGFFV